MDREANRQAASLTQINATEQVPQRRLARTLGSARGLTNLTPKRLARRGDTKPPCGWPRRPEPNA